MAVCGIRVNGHDGGRRSEWFDGLTIASVENGDAVLSGDIVDQSALHGVPSKVRIATFKGPEGNDVRLYGPPK